MTGAMDCAEQTNGARTRTSSEEQTRLRIWRGNGFMGRSGMNDLRHECIWNTRGRRARKKQQNRVKLFSPGNYCGNCSTFMTLSPSNFTKTVLAGGLPLI